MRITILAVVLVVVGCVDLPEPPDDLRAKLEAGRVDDLECQVPKGGLVLSNSCGVEIVPGVDCAYCLTGVPVDPVVANCSSSGHTWCTDDCGNCTVEAAAVKLGLF